MSEISDVNDGSTLQVHWNRFGEIVPVMNLFQYFGRYSDRLDVRCFVLGRRIHGISLVTRDGSAQRLTAAGGWVCCWPHWNGKELLGVVFVLTRWTLPPFEWGKR